MSTTPLRQRIAQECARLMVEDCIDDFQAAKSKAVARLGVPFKHLPSNSEIEAAVREYRRLFAPPAHAGRLREQRHAALQAMRLLAAFNPRLVGPVLSGTAHAHTDITLHLFADSHEEVAFFLMDRQIPYHLKERVYHASGESYPAYRFMAGGDSIVLVVFPVNGIRRAPPSPVDGKPMPRADTQSVEALLAGAA